MMRHGALILAAFLALAGCGKQITLTPATSVAHSATDFSSYAVAFNSPAEQTDFEKRLTAWTSEKGYASATRAELQVLHNTQPLDDYRIVRIKYPDAGNPGCSVLLTYRISGENAALIGLFLTRDGSGPSLERQAALVESERDAFVQQFQILGHPR